MHKSITLLFMLIATAFFAYADGSSVEVTRDDKGVWFITGPDDASYYDIYEAMGHSVATDRLWQMEKYRRAARGRLAEVFGDSLLQSDIFTRTFGYSEQELEQAFQKADDEVRQVLQGYVDGINRRIAEIRDEPKLKPFEFIILGMEIEEWKVTDVLAWAAGLQRNFDPEALEFDQLENAKLLEEMAKKHPQHYKDMFEDLRWRNDPKALTYIPMDGTRITREVPPFARWQQVAESGYGKAASKLKKIRREMIEAQQKISAYVKMGSYAWVVAGHKTVSGNPIVYSGPQMGFSTPAIVTEGSIRAGGLHISGMTVPGIPGLIIGRTPHHAWSMQVGHAHTVDYYEESPDKVQLHHVEEIKVAGKASVPLPVYRSAHGPIVHPMPYNPQTYNRSKDGPILAWKYAHWGYELNPFPGWLGFIRAKSIEEFAAALEHMAVSQHFTYADSDGNIAYWMSGRDPKRPAGEYRFPQPLNDPKEWDAKALSPRSHDRNPAKGFYSGWNNKSSAHYDNCYNNSNDIYGIFHRAHVIDEFLASHDKLSFEQIRELALFIATTNSFNGGGNPWQFVAKDFRAAVKAQPTSERLAALKILEDWDGHFVSGDWKTSKDKADAWMLMNRWLHKTVELTFTDELTTSSMNLSEHEYDLLFNVILHSLDNSEDGLRNRYDWFRNDDAKAPQTFTDIAVLALDQTLQELGQRPWGIDKRGKIGFRHDILGVIHSMPFAKRSTYAHIVEMGSNGPVRIESMFPLGQSGNILLENLLPVFDPHFFDMAPLFDKFEMREFPLFK